MRGLPRKPPWLQPSSDLRESELRLCTIAPMGADEKHMKTLLTLALLTATPHCLPAQTTFLVGPSGLPTIGDAIALASDGDVILVEPGAYGPMVIVDKSLTVRALVPGSVDTGGGLGNFLATLTKPQITVHLVGIQLRSIAGTNVRLTLEQCTTNAANGLLVTDGVCHVRQCTLQATPFALEVPALGLRNSHATILDSEVRGAGVGPAIAMIESTLQVSGSALFGGPDSAAAVRGDADSTLWLSDTSATGTASGCALQIADARIFRSTVAPACPATPRGLVLGTSQSQSLQAGAPVTFEFTTAPFHLVAVLASTGLATTSVGWIEQDLQLAFGGLFSADLLLANSQGNAVRTWTLPTSTALVDSALWLQGLSGYSLPLQAGPVAGGVVR